MSTNPTSNGIYIDRFRQLLAHEIENISKKPYALIDCEPEGNLSADTVHIRGLCEAGTKVFVAGKASKYYSAKKPFVFVANVPLKTGRNLIPIKLISASGQQKIVYREIYRK